MMAALLIVHLILIALYSPKHNRDLFHWSMLMPIIIHLLLSSDLLSAKLRKINGL